MTVPELNYLRANSNFTEEEAKIFELLAKGKSQKEICFKVNMSLRTVERRTKDIKTKIERLQKNGLSELWKENKGYGHRNNE